MTIPLAAGFNQKRKWHDWNVNQIYYQKAEHIQAIQWNIDAVKKDSLIIEEYTNVRGDASRPHRVKDDIPYYWKKYKQDKNFNTSNLSKKIYKT